MVRDELGCVHHANCDAIRIEPGVDLHIPVVGFGDDKFERVVLVIYSGKQAAIILPITLYASKPMRPWFEFRPIERISGWADLEDDGVDADSLQAVEHIHQFLLLRSRIADRAC